MKSTTTRGVSIFINIPLLWFILAIVRWRIDTAPLELALLNEGSALLRQILSGLILAGLLVLAVRRISLRMFVRTNPWIVLLFIYMGASFVWSAYPAISFKRWIKTFGVLVMVLMIWTEENPPEAIKALFRRYTYLTLPLSLVLIHLVPALGWRTLADGGREMIGITQGKNSLGILALMIAVYYTWEIWTAHRQGRVRKGDVVFLGMAVYTLAITNSVTSLFSYLAFLVIMTMLSLSVPNINRKFFLTVYAAVMAVLALNLFEELFIHGSFLALIFKSFGRDMTFTGRWDLWHYVLRIAGYFLVLGYGYGSFWIAGPHIYYAHEQWHANEAHNGYLDVYLELGAVGLMLLLAVIVSGYRKIVRDYPADPVFNGFRFALFVVVLLHNLTETSLCKLNNPLWFLFLLVVVTCPYPRIQPMQKTLSQGAG
ncbi:MAG: O-antigen ligase family protein [bacterium]